MAITPGGTALPKPTTYVARVAAVRVTATHGSGRVDLTLLAETVRLDSVESAALVRVLVEARRRAERAGVEPAER